MISLTTFFLVPHFDRKNQAAYWFSVVFSKRNSKIYGMLKTSH